MKELILTLTLFLVCTFYSYAQSGATWDETVNFIQKNSEYLHTTCNNNDCCYYEVSNFNIRNGSMKYTSLRGEGNNESKVDINLNKLSNVYKIKKNNNWIGIGMQFVSRSVNMHYAPYIKGKSQFSLNGCSFHICDKEMLPRIFKAFTHLTKLATEKRKEEIKASGDKF